MREMVRSEKARGNVIIQEEVGKKLKIGKMRATRLVETLSRIMVTELVKLRQLLRLTPQTGAV